MSQTLLSPGFSEAAQLIELAAREQRFKLREPNYFGRHRSFEELAEIIEVCRQPDWDGHGALPVSMDAALNAHDFLVALPLGYEAPSIEAEPDGSITAEWYCGPRRILSVSISSDRDLHFAALFGPNRAYGTEAFFDEVPDSILDTIRRVYSE